MSRPTREELTKRKKNQYINKYNYRTYKSISLRFRNEEDKEIIEWLSKQPSHNSYIKNLILEDMKKSIK